jgi:hypothetical protein
MPAVISGYHPCRLNTVDTSTRRSTTPGCWIAVRNPTPSGEELHVRAEHLDRPEAAVQEDERLAFADDLVAELDPVDPGNTGDIRRHRHIVLAVAGT